jgi:hypothetical protein
MAALNDPRLITDDQGSGCRKFKMYNCVSDLYSTDKCTKPRPDQDIGTIIATFSEEQSLAAGLRAMRQNAIRDFGRSFGFNSWISFLALSENPHRGTRPSWLHPMMRRLQRIQLE